MFRGMLRMLAFLLALFFLTLGVITSPEFQFLSTPSSVTAEEAWNVRDMIDMGKSGTMAAAVSHMASAAGISVTTMSTLEGIKQMIDNAAADDIRGALLVATSANANANANKKSAMMNTKIDNFAATDNPAATCASPETVGWHGRDTCVSACQHTRRVLSASTPRKASCYMLCTLATAPCTVEPAWWGATAMNWMTMAAKTTCTGMQELWAVTAASMKIAFFVVLWLHSREHFDIKSRQAKKHVQQAEDRLKSKKLDMLAVKIRHVDEARSRNLKTQALYKLHDHFVMAAYRDSDEGKNKNASLQLILGILTRREKRVIGASFGRWRKTAATMKAVAIQAVIDAIVDAPST